MKHTIKMILRSLEFSILHVRFRSGFIAHQQAAQNRWKGLQSRMRVDRGMDALPAAGVAKWPRQALCTLGAHKKRKQLCVTRYVFRA